MEQFQFLIENYTNTCYVDPQRALSPIGKINSSTASNFKPMYFINSEHDTMPFHQILDIKSALEGAGVATSKYQVVTIPDSREHAFDYWLTWDGGPDPDKTWGDHVMDFVSPYLQ